MKERKESFVFNKHKISAFLIMGRHLLERNYPALKKNKSKPNHPSLVYYPPDELDNMVPEITIPEMEQEIDLGDAEWNIVQGTTMSNKQKQCMWLYYWEGITQKTIGDILGIAQPVVNRYLKSAKVSMCKIYGKSTDLIKGNRNGSKTSSHL